MISCFPDRKHFLRSSSENKTKNILPALLAVIMLSAVSCEEDASLIGRKLLPDSDFVTINSTLLSTRSYTMYSDSIQSGMPSISYLGKIFDPYFGETSASFVTQIRLGDEWNSGYPFVDSMKLFLKLLTVKGDTADDHYLRLSEIAEEIFVESTYYSGIPVPLTGYTVPDILLPPLRADTVNDIVVNVDTVFAKYLIRDPSRLTYDTKPDFKSFFKGLQFEIISPDDPVFVSLSIASTTGSYSNFFVLYLSNELGQVREYPFRIDAATANAGFNLFSHNFDAAEPDKKLQHINDTSYLDTLSYSQIFNGVYTKMILTDLDSLRNDVTMKNISVNRARLKIPVVYDNDIYKRTTLPATLFARFNTRSGRKYLVPETYTSFYNGTADTTAASPLDDVYTLNIASFVQDYLNDKSDTILPVLDLFLLPGSSNNLLLRANNNSRPVKFEFTYTKF